MEKEIVFSKRFLRHIDKLTEYLLKEWNERVVLEMFSKLDKRINDIRKNPSLGQPSVKFTGVRSLLVKPYQRIYYREKKNVITILALIDNRKNHQKNPYK